MEKNKNILKRIISIILLLGFVVLLGIFIYTIVSGSAYVIQMLFVVIIYPVIIYIVVWLRKVFEK